MIHLLLPKQVCTKEKLAKVVRESFPWLLAMIAEGQHALHMSLIQSPRQCLLNCTLNGTPAMALKMTKAGPALAGWHGMPLRPTQAVLLQGSWVTRRNRGAPGVTLMTDCSLRELLCLVATPSFSGRARTHKSSFQSASWRLHWCGDSPSSTGCAQLYTLFFRSYFINPNFTRT